jgi:hypothetical protein
VVFAATAESLELTTENVEAVLDEVMNAKQLLPVNMTNILYQLGHFLSKAGDEPKCIPVVRVVVSVACRYGRISYQMVVM